MSTKTPTTPSTCSSKNLVGANARQDTGRRTLTRTPAELVVVGDADQSIYAFRGATIRNILQFEEDYPNARTILLEQNYRSTQNILSAANAVIARTSIANPRSSGATAGSGWPIVGYVADNEHDEASFVAQTVDELSATPVKAKPNDVAVFYRTNSQSACFEEVFIRVGLPYKVVGGVRFYERREVRDALAYLRVLANPDDVVSLRRILNTPERGIGDKAEHASRAMPSASASRSRRRSSQRRRGTRAASTFGERHQGLRAADRGAPDSGRVGHRPSDAVGGGA